MQVASLRLLGSLHLKVIKLHVEPSKVRVVGCYS